MEIVHALRGLSINGGGGGGSGCQRQAMAGKSGDQKDPDCQRMGDNNKSDRRTSKLKTLPPKSPKKMSVSNNSNNVKKLPNKSVDEDSKNAARSQSLGGYYNNRSDKGSDVDAPISRKSSLSSLTSLIGMASPRLFPRFGSKSVSGSGRKRSTPLSPHRENACTDDFNPVNGSSRNSSRAGSPAPSECQSLRSVTIRCRSQSPDLLSNCGRINPIGIDYRPELYLDPNQGRAGSN